MRWFHVFDPEGYPLYDTHWLHVSEGRNSVGVLRKLDDAESTRLTLIWLSLDGSLLSEEILFQGDYIRLSDFTTDTDGHVYLAGTFRGTSLETNHFTLSAPDNRSDGFVAEYGPAGTFIRVEHMTDPIGRKLAPLPLIRRMSYWSLAISPTPPIWATTRSLRTKAIYSSPITVPRPCHRSPRIKFRLR